MRGQAHWVSVYVGRSLDASLSNLLKEPEYADSRRRSYVNFPIHDHRGDEFVARSEMIAPVRCLVAVVEFGCQISGVVCVENRSVGVLGGPENRIAGSVGRNAGSRLTPMKQLFSLVRVDG